MSFGEPIHISHGYIIGMELLTQIGMYIFSISRHCQTLFKMFTQI